MNWRGWRYSWHCWFREHEYEVQEIKPDPRHPEHSATLLWYMAEGVGGAAAVKKCRRCYRVDDIVPTSSPSEEGTMKLCYNCLDDLHGTERMRKFRTTTGQTCDRCRRIETDNPPSRAQST